MRKVIFSSRRHLNRLIFDPKECIVSNDEMIVTLNITDNRCKHVTTILKSEIGDYLKIGILNQGNNDRGQLIEKSSEQLTFRLGHPKDIVPNSIPLVDLILAVPRPLRLERILPVVTSQGIGRLVLVDAEKVEKDYFGSHLFRRPQALQDCLIEGLSQGGVDCNLPQVLVRRNLYKFMRDELNVLFDPSTHLRVICHPLKNTELDVSSAQFTTLQGTPLTQRIVLAIGPEGGWTDGEVAAFKAQGFRNVDLGHRILRTDTAVTAALGLAHEWAALHLENDG